MKRILLVLSVIMLLAVEVNAQPLEAPIVPGGAAKFMPDEGGTFLEGFAQVIRDGIIYAFPDLKEAVKASVGIIASVIMMSIFSGLDRQSGRVIQLSGILLICYMLLSGSNSMINLAAQSITEIASYGKLLLPVMTAALAAEGGMNTAGSLYAVTAFFNMILTELLSRFLTPIVYVFLILSVASAAIEEEFLKKTKQVIMWSMTWFLKIILYAFTGFISVTGVISGSVDAAAVKATKLAISSMVPIIGGILSDASEAILLSAETIKNSAGIYGFFAVIAITLGPFLKIGVHYLVLKAVAAIGTVFLDKGRVEVIYDFSSALGLLLASTGTISLMQLISLICYLRGAG